MKSLLSIATIGILFASCGESAENDTQANDTLTTETHSEMGQAVGVMTAEGEPVPEAVNNSFKAAYPDVVGAGWAWEDSMYTAEFNNNGLDMAVVYKPDGTRHAVVASIATEYLPGPVMKAAKTLGPITSAKKITMANETVRYEVLVKDEDYFYDEAGAMIQEKEAKEDIRRLMKKDK